MQIISLVIYVVRKTRADSLSPCAKSVFGTYALCLLLTIIALPVLNGLILHEVIKDLMFSEEERPDVVWTPKLMSIYCLSTFWGLSTHIGLPATVIRRLPQRKIVWPIAGLTTIATIILSVVGSILVVRITNSDFGYALLSCGNSLPYLHSCGMIWYFMPKESKQKHWKSWCVWTLNFVAAVCVLALLCLLPLQQTQWFLPGQLITIFTSQIPWVLGASINGIMKLKPAYPAIPMSRVSAGSSKQDVLDTYKEEENLTILERVPAMYHGWEHGIQSSHDCQEVGQAV